MTPITDIRVPIYIIYNYTYIAHIYIDTPLQFVPFDIFSLFNQKLISESKDIVMYKSMQIQEAGVQVGVMDFFCDSIDVNLVDKNVIARILLQIIVEHNICPSCLRSRWLLRILRASEAGRWLEFECRS